VGAWTALVLCLLLFHAPFLLAQSPSSASPPAVLRVGVCSAPPPPQSADPLSAEAYRWRAASAIVHGIRIAQLALTNTPLVVRTSLRQSFNLSLQLSEIDCPPNMDQTEANAAQVIQVREKRRRDEEAPDMARRYWFCPAYTALWH
jgi:hypothetical protein